MEIGIDSFAASMKKAEGGMQSGSEAIEAIIERAEKAEEVNLDSFSIGEHHRPEYFDSANHVILGAIAARTKKIRLASAVTVLSAADPVRVFQNFATLDLISKGRVDLVVGRGSFSEAFPLFGYDMRDYDELFEEKLDLLLKIRDTEEINWSGKFRPELVGQKVYPRPFNGSLPIWRGVGGSPESFIKAGKDGLPLMVAIIGGETERFAPLVEHYRKAYLKAGHPKEKMKVGMHAMGYLAEESEKAKEEFFPGHSMSFNKIGKERGWGLYNIKTYKVATGKNGAYLIGDVNEVVEKIKRHSETLGGLDRVSFQMDTSLLPQEKLLKSIELIGEVRKGLV